MKKYYILGLILILGFTSLAATPLYSTKVQEALKLFVDSLDFASGKFKSVDFLDNTSQTTKSSPANSTPKILYQTNVPVIVNGTTTDTIVATYAVTGGTMGNNSILEFYCNVSCGTTSIKTVKVLADGSAMSNIWDTIGTTTTAINTYSQLINKGSTTNQLIMPLWWVTSTTSANSVPTVSLNTTNNITYTLVVNPGTTTQSMTLNSFCVTYYPSPQD